MEAISRSCLPAAAARTKRQRKATCCGVLGAASHRTTCSRSSAAKLTSGLILAMRTHISYWPQYVYLFMIHTTRDQTAQAEALSAMITGKTVNPFNPSQNPNYGPKPTLEKPPASVESWLRVYSVPELLKMDVKPREMLLHPFLPTQGLAMLYSQRGAGKTFISLGISIAVASGSPFLKWNAPTAGKVLYVDGEMPFSALHQRIIDVNAGFNIDHPLENLRVITPDLQDRGLPDLSTISGQDQIEGHLEGVNLLVLDN